MKNRVLIISVGEQAPMMPGQYSKRDTSPRRGNSDSSLFNTYTPLTAQQEVAAFAMAQAMLVEWRLQAGDYLGVEPLHITFAMLLTWMRSLWSTLALLDGIVRLSTQQEARLAERLFDLLGDSLTPPRRHRSCPRAVGQPVSIWPRLMRNRSFTEGFHFEVIRKYRSKGWRHCF